MIYTPIKNNKAKAIAPIFIIAGFAVMAISSLMPYKAFIQLGAVVLIVIGLQTMVRYILCDYRYIIDDRSDGTCDLIVMKIQGKREEKVCHVSLHNITDMYPRGERSIKADASYNYTQNIGARSYDIIFADGRRTVKIILEADAVFVDAIRSRMTADGDGGTAFAM